MPLSATLQLELGPELWEAAQTQAGESRDDGWNFDDYAKASGLSPEKLLRGFASGSGGQRSASLSIAGADHEGSLELTERFLFVVVASYLLGDQLDERAYRMLFMNKTGKATSALRTALGSFAEKLRKFCLGLSTDELKRVLGSAKIVVCERVEAPGRIDVKRSSRLRDKDLWFDDGEQDLRSVLSWRRRVASVGMDRRLEPLLQWIESDRMVDGCVLSGPGGVGKSRVAAELCSRLRDQGWTARFLHPGFTIPQDGDGKRLYVLDYPEERLEEIATLIRWALESTPSDPLRILLMSRRDRDELCAFTQMLQLHSSADLIRCDIVVPWLKEDEATDLFLAAADAFSSSKETRLPSRAHVLEWVKLRPDLHCRPLFVLSAAFHAARSDHPDPEILSGSAIFEAMARRELNRIACHARDGLDPEALMAVTALATLGRGLSRRTIALLADQMTVSSRSLLACAKHTDHWRGGRLMSPDPDVLASAIFVEAARSTSLIDVESVGIAIDAAVEDDVGRVTDRLARVLHDANTTYGFERHPLEKLLTAVVDDPDRAQKLAQLSDDPRPADSLSRLVVAIDRGLLRGSESEAEIADASTRLANHLARSGFAEEALEHASRAVEIREGLAAKNPVIVNELADSLFVLAHVREQARDFQSAADLLSRVIEIRKRARRSIEDQHELFRALNNRGNALRSLDQLDEAASSFESAIEIARQLVDSMEPSSRQPWRDASVFRDELARGLTNHAVVVERQGALDQARRLSKEAVGIRRELSREKPWRYERYLALSLGNSMTCSEDEALSILEEVVAIRRRLFLQNPFEHGFDLAWDLSRLRDLRHARGEKKKAVEAAAEQIEIADRVVSAGVREKDLSWQLLTRIGSFLDQAVDDWPLLHELEEGLVDFIDRSQNRPYWDAAFKYWEAGCYLNIGNIRRAAKKLGEAADFYSRALKIVDEIRSESVSVQDVESLALLNRANVQVATDTEAASSDFDAACAAIQSKRSQREQDPGSWMPILSSLAALQSSFRDVLPEQAHAAGRMLDELRRLSTGSNSPEVIRQGLERAVESSHRQGCADSRLREWLDRARELPEALRVPVFENAIAYGLASLSTFDEPVTVAELRQELSTFDQTPLPQEGFNRGAFLDSHAFLRLELVKRLQSSKKDNSEISRLLSEAEQKLSEASKIFRESQSDEGVKTVERRLETQGRLADSDGDQASESA